MLSISEDTHPELYSIPIETSLKFAKCLNDNSYCEPEKIKYHFYWKVGRDFSRKQSLTIKSFFATQDLNKCELYLWSNIDLSNNPFLSQFKKQINFKIYNPLIEANFTNLEGCDNILSAEDDLCYLNSDLMRILILNNYGGVYCDMDMVLLRDLSPLLPYEFMYKWGCLPDKYGINGAIMRLYKKSKLCHDLLNEIKNTKLDMHKFYLHIWNRMLYSNVRQHNKNWLVLPSSFFNSEWQDDLNQKWTTDEWNAFNNKSFKMYDGCFSWHWHNRWDDHIHPNSKWQFVEKMIEEKLKK